VLHSPQLSTASVKTYSSIRININGADYANQYVVFALTSFESSAYAAPGTFQITLQDPKRTLSFVGGEYVQVVIDGTPVYAGYVLEVTRSTWLEDSLGSQAVSGRRWDLAGTDLNILFDKLFTYNHSNPAIFPDGGGRYPGGVLPVGTHDIDAIKASLADTDINLIKPTIDITRRISDNGDLIPVPPKGQLMTAGTSFRAFMTQWSAEISAVISDAGDDLGTTGSMIFYINPQAQLVYQRRDNVGAPFAVNDDPNLGGVQVRGLQFTTDISAIKNDVLLFGTNIFPPPNDPNQPASPSQLVFRHNSLSASIAKYGRFQYAEVINPETLAPADLQARSSKLLFQQGTPAERATFDCFVPGLYPGQLVTIASTPWNYERVVPIRNLTLSFPTPTLAVWHVECGFDTLDPWGLIMALRRPAQRGFVPPRFQTITLTPGQTPPAVDPYTFVEEIPKSLGGGRYQTSYAYIRYSITVHAGGLRLISNDGALGGKTLAFNESAPDQGQFYVSSDVTGGGQIYCAYHVAAPL
jgi:hypothetical protein